VVTSGYFHSRAVLSTLDVLGRLHTSPGDPQTEPADKTSPPKHNLNRVADLLLCLCACSGVKCLAIKSWMRGTHTRNHLDDDSDDVGDWDDDSA
jgi:hypothetical protein